MAEDAQTLTRVRRSVERFVSARPDAGDPADVEDVVQEAMVRLLENRSRLQPDTWEAYAVVSARNLLLDRHRAREVRRRHGHRLHAPDVTPSPEDQVLTDEEHSAVRRAMTRLPREDATLLDGRYGTDDVPSRSVAPAAAARLARARARLRVAYLLEHTGLPLPSPRCRPVLEALSSGDRRRQERLGAARHLLTCRVCASYAPVLTRRQRALAALYPLAWAGAGAGAVWAAVRRHPGRSGTAAATTAVVLVAGTVAVTGPSTSPDVVRSPEPTPSAPARTSGSVTLTGGGRTLLPVDGSPLGTGPVEAVDVAVESVPSDEGFWIGDGPGRRLWVRLLGGGESGVAIRPGDRLSFAGQAVAVPAGYLDAAGVTQAEGAAELREQGVLVQVRHDAVVVAPR